MRCGPAHEDLLVWQGVGVFPLQCWRLSVSSQNCWGQEFGVGRGRVTCFGRSPLSQVVGHTLLSQPRCSLGEQAMPLSMFLLPESDSVHL